MAGKASYCSKCDQYFDSKTELKRHIDQNHRITDEDIEAKKD